MFWISSLLHEHVSEVTILPFFRSDHSYVFLRVAFPSLPRRGPGVWKFNTSLLREETLCTEVCNFWVSWQSEKDTFPSLAIWWDAGKARLKEILRHFSRGKARSRRLSMRDLESTLEHLHKRVADGEDVNHLIKEVQDKLELEHHHVAQGARIRGNQQWAEEGETSSAFFFRQEKVHASRRLFTGIRDAQGTIVRSISAILRVWCIFYVQLFSASILSSPDQSFFLNSLEQSLSAEEAQLCEGEVTLQECQRALNSFKRNKSPDLDGLPYEFYQSFWDILGPDLVAVYNDCLAQGALSFFQRTG
jgi:hypothetical protein